MASDVAYASEDPRFTPAVVARVAASVLEAETTGARVGAWDQIKHVLSEAKLGWLQQIEASFCGVHPQNRSQQGVGGSEAHNHGRDILKASFSWSRAADAVAVEMPPSGQRKIDAIVFNQTMSELSGGLVPPIEVLKVLSISGSHTNTFLRAVVAGCESACDELADPATGRLSSEKLCLNRDSFKQAVEGGLRWFVLQHECELVWPGLITLVEKSLNTEAREHQSEIECMLAMHHAQARAVRTGKEPDWQKIESDASCSLPPCASWMNVLGEYVRMNAGGVEDCELLHDLNMFSRACRCSQAGSKRILGSDFFRKLASLTFGIDRYPYVLNACIKANLTSPANKVTDGFCKLVLPTHLSSLTSKEQRPLLVEAEQIMTDARKLVKALMVPQAKAVMLIGKLDVRAVVHVLKLGKTAEGKVYENIAEIAEVPCLSMLMCMHDDSMIA